MRFLSGGRSRRLGAAGAAFFAAAALSAAPAYAQGKPAAPAAQAPQASPAQIALAKQLLEANGEAKSFDALIPNVIEQAAGSFVQANPDLIRDLREVAAALIPQYEGRRGEIDEILARTYASQFTEAELKQIITFYQSPVGVKLVEKRPIILDMGMRGVQLWSQQLARDVEGKVREEMKKRGYTI